MNLRQRLNYVICLTILSFCLGLLMMATVYASSKGITVNKSRHNPSLRPLTQATATATCPVPSAWGRQPYPTEMVNSFDRAGTDLLGDEGPDLPDIWKGYPPAQATPVPAYVPCILLKAMGYEETPEWGGWKQFDAACGQYGYTTIFHDPGGSCGYGVMQITSGMEGGAGFDPNRVATEYPYNIGTGAKVLTDKWNGMSNYIGDNNPHVVEDWYYAVWAYNGWSWYNNPNNNCLPTWFLGCGGWYQDRPPYDETQNRHWYPYQELVWGRAAHPPGADFWQPAPLTLPPRADVYAGPGVHPPPTHIDRPEPHHGSCGVSYLPIVLKNYPPSVPTPTPTPTPTPSCVEGSNLIQNGGFEEGTGVSGNRSAPPWVQSPVNYLVWDEEVPRWSGNWGVWLGGYDNANDEICQSVVIPTGAGYGTLTFYLRMYTSESASYPYDYFYVHIKDSDGNTLTSVSEDNTTLDGDRWYVYSIDITNLISFGGQTMRVCFHATTDSSYLTSFYVDDVGFIMHCSPYP